MTPGDDGPPPGPDPLPTPLISRADIPAISSQPTARGRTMRIGPEIDAGVLVLFGDYPTNTGPIDIIAVSREGVVTTLLESFDTEETDNARLLDGAAWLPSIDPRGSGPGSLATNYGGTWHARLVQIAGLAVVEHLYDVALEGGRLVTCGAHVPDTAFVWESPDHGETYTEALAYPSGLADGDNRFLEFRRKNGRLGVERSNQSGYYLRQDDGSWTFAAGAPSWDPTGRPVVSVSGDGTTWNVTVPGAGLAARIPIAAARVTASVGTDGSVWLCDSESIYLLPPP